MNHFPASRAGAEVLVHAGDSSLHSGSGPSHLGRVPTVRLTQSISKTTEW